MMPENGHHTPDIKSLLVIGGSGFIGSYIVRLAVSQGYHVRATHHKSLDERVRDLAGPSVEWIQLDVLHIFDLMEAMEGMDAVINTAAIVSYSSIKKKMAFKLAREGTLNVVQACADTGIKKLVHLSSVAALGRKKLENTINESAIFSHSAFDTWYGLSKFLAEQEVWRAHYEGLPVTILNPSMVIGAGPWGQSSTRLITSVYEGLSFFPTGKTGFVDVRDVALASLKALAFEYNGKRFIISAQNLTYEFVLKTIANHLGINTRWKTLTPFVAAWAWRWGAVKFFITGREAAITKDNAQSTRTINDYDNSHSIEKLHISYRSVLSSIESTCRLFLKTSHTATRFDMLEE